MRHRSLPCLCIYILSKTLSLRLQRYLWQRPWHHQSWKFLLSVPAQKKFADPYLKSQNKTGALSARNNVWQQWLLRCLFDFQKVAYPSFHKAVGISMVPLMLWRPTLLPLSFVLLVRWWRIVRNPVPLLCSGFRGTLCCHRQIATLSVPYRVARKRHWPPNLLATTSQFPFPYSSCPKF
jgi:hypothetical protein